MIRARIDETIRRLELVRREEFEAVQELAANARAGQEAAEARLAALEARHRGAGSARGRASRAPAAGAAALRARDHVMMPTMLLHRGNRCIWSTPAVAVTCDAAIPAGRLVLVASWESGRNILNPPRRPAFLQQGRPACQP